MKWRTLATTTTVLLLYQGIPCSVSGFTPRQHAAPSRAASTSNSKESTTTQVFSTVLAPPSSSSSSSTTQTLLPKNIQQVWGIEPQVDNFAGANFPFGTDSEKPPILELPQFLTADECRQIRQWALDAMQDGAEECDDYLNYRVNQEVNEGGVSQEGQALIEDCNVQESSLSSSHKGGFRLRLDNQFVENMIGDRLLDLLGMPNRDFVYEEGAWIRPTPKTVVVRDQTVVFYGPSNGVPPHVDGKDGTLLVYLCDGTYAYT